MYIDFHTHHVPQSRDVVAVVDGRDTWGIHPWHATEEFSVPDLTGKIAIGECGLDACCGIDLRLQKEVLTLHVALADATARVLTLHCVKALDLLLKMHKELKPKQLWMLHGFRGKPQQLRSLLDAGFYVSFGYRHNDESLRICPIDRMLLETDNDLAHPIQEIYNNVARKRGLEVTELCEAMQKNYRAFFQKEPLLI